MKEPDSGQSPISQIADEKGFSDEEKKTKFVNATIIKISGPNADFLAKIIAYLEKGFDVSPTSAKMYNDEKKQFFMFIKISPKEA